MATGIPIRSSDPTRAASVAVAEDRRGFDDNLERMRDVQRCGGDESSSRSVEPPELLIVDDDPISIRVIRNALSVYPNVRFATSGGAALDRARERAPDLILLDAEMPGKDGLEVCRELKSDPALCSIPVIFITARDDIDFEAAALRLGADDFLRKPVSPLLVELRVKLHLKLKRQLDALRQLATTDVLTGLWNRSAFDIALDTEWRRAHRHRQQLALLLVDVDHFKAYNDTYGHPAGDTCLKRVAAILRASLRRPGDLAARYGGEEFALLLPDTDADGAYHVACDVVRSVSDARLPHRGSRVSEFVTISVGMATTAGSWNGDDASDDGPHTLALVEAADAALYAAKHRGRNRVERASDPPLAARPSTPVPPTAATES